MFASYTRLLRMTNALRRKLTYENTSIGRRNAGRPKKRRKCKQSSRRNKPPMAYNMVLIRISSFAPITLQQEST